MKECVEPLSAIGTKSIDLRTDIACTYSISKTRRIYSCMRKTFGTISKRHTFPDMSCMEILQIQLGVGTLVSNQERRAAVVHRMNREKTADKPRIHRLSTSSTAGFVLPSFYIDFLCSCFQKQALDSFFDRLENKRDACFLGKPTCRRPDLPVIAPPNRPAERRPVLTHPWYVRVLHYTMIDFSIAIVKPEDNSNSLTYVLLTQRNQKISSFCAFEKQYVSPSSFFRLE